MAVVSHPTLGDNIDLDANYGSLELFTRAFRNAFGVSPSLYRRMGATYTHLHTANGIHHRSGKDDTKGIRQSMDLFVSSPARSWHRDVSRSGEGAESRTIGPPSEQPDTCISMGWSGSEPAPTSGPMVQTKEACPAAMTGGSTPLFDNALRTASSAMLVRCIKRIEGSIAYSPRPQSERLGGHVCRCSMRTPGNLHLWWHVRRRDYVPCLPADGCHRFAAGLWSEVEGVGCPMEYLESLTRRQAEEPRPCRGDPPRPPALPSGPL